MLLTRVETAGDYACLWCSMLPWRRSPPSNLAGHRREADRVAVHSPPVGLEADCIRPDAILPNGAWRSIYKRPHPKAVDNGSTVWEAGHNLSLIHI